MAIPVYAADTELVQISLTGEDLYNIWYNGDMNIVGQISFSKKNGFYTNYSDNTSGSFSQLNIPNSLWSAQIIDNSFFCFSPYLIEFEGSPSTYSSGYTISFPFSYYLTDTSISCSFYHPIQASDNDRLAITVYYDNTSTVFEDTLDSYILTTYSNDPFASHWASRYSYSPPSWAETQRFYYNVPISVSGLTSSLQFYQYVTYYENAYRYQIRSPYGFIIDSFNVYVEQEVSSVVEEYLDVIAGSPSPENQQKINDLKDQMQDIDDQLKQDASDMQVEIPDISDVESIIPEELTQGNEIVSQQVLSPIFNAQPIATIFLGLFAIVSLKLFLFGSGPH